MILVTGATGLVGNKIMKMCKDTQSMYEITKGFLTLIGKDIKVEDAPSRHNLWMNCEKAKKYGVEFHSVEDGLKMCAEDYNLLT